VNSEKNEQAEKVAIQILHFARNELLVALRFMDMALCKLEYESYYDSPDFPIATNGEVIVYNPYFIFSKYKKAKEEVNRLYLHMILHCIFYHPFVGDNIDIALWDLCCDIAVENIINEMALKQVDSVQRRNAEDREIQKISGMDGKITAEKLYHYYVKNNISDQEIDRLSRVFSQDDHSIWYVKSDEEAENGNQGEKPDDDAKVSSTGGEVSSVGDQDENKQDAEEKSTSSQIKKQQTITEWQEISERAQVDLETASKEWGDKSGNLVQNIQEANREKYDYSGFLQKFAIMGEDIQINDDEFDYIFYTYGLKLYDKMPLIEPLEYKEVKKIKEFVIAIDTSGSVQGDLVQKFVTKTYNILMQQENFFSKINIHIIQCDTDIQSDIKITSKEEFESAINSLELRGFGGTDFRPVFEYVDDLAHKGEFINLKGLIYFTDGYGTFPSKKPNYETAFVFIEEEYEKPEIPVWAIRLVLRPDEI